MLSLNEYFRGQIVIGLLVCVACIAVHAIIMASLTATAHRTTTITATLHLRLRLVLVMSATVSVLMAAHLMEVGIWGLAYVWLHAVPDQVDAYYFAFVNYTTLGYGDVLPVKNWRLLGPMTAMNGVLMFGWSTAVLYDVLRTVAEVVPAASAPGTDASTR